MRLNHHPHLNQLFRTQTVFFLLTVSRDSRGELSRRPQAYRKHSFFSFTHDRGYHLQEVLVTLTLLETSHQLQ